VILLRSGLVEDCDKNRPVVAKSGWLQSFPNTEARKQRTERNPQDVVLSKQGAWSVGNKFGSNKHAVREHQQNHNTSN